MRLSIIYTVLLMLLHRLRDLLIRLPYPMQTTITITIVLNNHFSHEQLVFYKTEETGNENTEEGRNNMNIRNYAMEPEIPDPNMYFEDGNHFELPRESEHIFNLEFDYNDINDVGEDDSIDGANSKMGHNKIV